MQTNHNVVVGYVFWLFGFFGAHRFYYGKPLTGILWLFTGGLLLIGWIVDLFLIPRMNEEANRRYPPGPYDYNVAWLLHVFLGVLGLHRFYLGFWVSGLIWLLTGGIFFVGWLYDWLTLNELVEEANAAASAARPLKPVY
jgi:TM2 domain-containing membrane protein YozV